MMIAIPTIDNAAPASDTPGGGGGTHEKGDGKEGDLKRVRQQAP